MKIISDDKCTGAKELMDCMNKGLPASFFLNLAFCKVFEFINFSVRYLEK